MEFVIITGMSGAGKTGALHVLEDIGIIVLTIFRQVCCQHSIGFASNLKMIQ